VTLRVHPTRACSPRNRLMRRQPITPQLWVARRPGGWARQRPRFLVQLPSPAGWLDRRHCRPARQQQRRPSPPASRLRRLTLLRCRLSSRLRLPARRPSCGAPGSSRDEAVRLNFGLTARIQGASRDSGVATVALEAPTRTNVTASRQSRAPAGIEQACQPRRAGGTGFFTRP
jgi:hypothetical protein